LNGGATTSAPVSTGAITTALLVVNDWRDTAD
jgi:hypothetical protein